MVIARPCNLTENYLRTVDKRSLIMDARNPDSTMESRAAGLNAGLPAALANVPIAAVSASVLHDTVDTEILLGWLALFTLIVGGRAGVAYWQSQSKTPVRQRIAAHTIGATLSGLLWGALPLLLMERGAFTDYAFCGFVIAGMTAGALPSLSWHRPAYLGYLLGATLPLSASLFALAEDPFPAMGSLTLLYALVLILTGKRYNRTLGETLKLRDDVTELGRQLVSTQDELVTTDLEKWRTISHLSHELRTPLNAVIGFSEMIERRTLGPLDKPEYAVYARNIRESGETILLLVENLLELSNASAGDMALTRTPTDCRRLVNDCIGARALQAEQAHVAIVVDLSSHKAEAHADPAKLRIAIDSILDNAIRYTPGGGRVSIGATIGRNDDIVITVADTGIGMTPEEVEIALSPFGRIASPLVQHLPGTGLGLPLARLLVEMHGGSLGVTSAPGDGTTVTLRIPRRVALLPSQQARTA